MTFQANSYTIQLTNGDTLSPAIGDVGTTSNAAALVNRYDTSQTSLKLLRRGAYNYSDVISENFTRLMENFTNTTAPTHPLKGQLWYDVSSGGTLKVYDGGNWDQISSGVLGQTVNISLSGAVAGTVPFNGGSSVNIATTLADVPGLVGGTYAVPTLTVDTKGRITAISGGSSLTSTTIISTLGYTPANDALVVHKTGDTMSGSLTINSGNMNVATGKVKEGGNDLLPRGIITMWNGSTAPAGWSLCDGSNGTPDLRNRFIVSYGGSYGIGATGGNDFVTATTSSAGAHGHSVAINSAGAHNHGGVVTGTALSVAQIPSHQHATGFGENPSRGYTGRYGNTGTTNNAGSNGGIDNDNVDMLTSLIGGGQAHDHGINGVGDHTHTGSATGVGDHNHTASHDNRPPYYALAYIMKL